MEFIVLSSVIGLGFMLNKDGVDRENTIKHISNKIYSNGTNIYNSEDTVKYRKREQSMANELYNKATNSIKSNVIIAGPPSAMISGNKKYNNSILPLEFDNDTTLINTKSLPKEIVFNNINISDSGNDESSGWNKMIHEYDKEMLHKTNISQLTGEEFENYHNNCVPYFGSGVTQNVNENATGTIVDMMTGADKAYREKCEIPVMFKPTTNITNPYGSQS